ncbi:MAG: hypothetical protein WCG93_12895 [Paludibacter sp.]
MDTINFTNDKKNFPLSTQALEFMKLLSQRSYQLASLGGVGNYILSGCVNTSGTSWTTGWVVVNGELLPFVAGSGTLTSNVRIVETKESVTAGYETYADVFVRRTVEFGSNVGGTNTFVWNTFTRVKSNLELAAESATKTELAALSNLVMPKGFIGMWSGTTEAIPTGFALCDGATVEGVVTPDLRGRFIVGLDPRINQSIATNVADLTENYGVVRSTGGKPRVKLTSDESGLPAHKHRADGGMTYSGYAGLKYGANQEAQAGGDIDGGAKDASTAHENRPPYYVLAFIIKVV